MRPFIVKQLDYDLTPVAGLALVGHHLNRLAPVFKQLDAALPVRNGVANSDILRSYLGLLVQGKSDFDAIENFRGDAFFKQALGIQLLASSPTLRQRMDTRADELFDFLPRLIEKLLDSTRVDYGVLPCGWLPLDVDTFAMDNGGTTKDGVGRTYTGVDGYCPLAAYLGSHGFCLELALRPGVQHSARETQFNFERVIPMAQRLSAAGPKAPILARLDSGFDSSELVREMEAYNAAGVSQLDWLIKVRREVAYVIVSPAHEVGDETGRSVGRSLPVHASSATTSFEATGTKYRAFGPRRLPRGKDVTCQRQRGWGARLGGMVNRSELLQASLARTSQRC